MIFVDASAMVAVLCREEAMLRIGAAIDGGERLLTSPIAIYETVMAVIRRKGTSRTTAAAEVDRMIVAAYMDVVPIDASVGERALAAFDQFGKGRHPAKLNMGDCFAYAVAKTYGARILFVGDDFTHTDLISALPATRLEQP